MANTISNVTNRISSPRVLNNVVGIVTSFEQPRNISVASIKSAFIASVVNLKLAGNDTSSVQFLEHIPKTIKFHMFDVNAG